MSHKATAWAFHQRLKPAPKMILMYLADAHNGIHGWCFPSIKTIANGCLLSESSVHKYLSQLEEDAELITRKFRYVEDRQTSSEYILHFDKHKGSEENTPPSEEYIPINQGSLTREVNTPSESSKTPVGVPEPPTRSAKRKPSPVPADEYECMTPIPRSDTPARPVQISKAIAPIIDRWFEVGVRHGPTAKALRNGVRAAKEVLAGTFFEDKSAYQDKIRPYSLDEVLRALDTFDLKRNSSDYAPSNKRFLKSAGLAEFFYSPRAQNGNGGGGGGSFFLQCLEKEAVPTAERYPELTAFVLGKYEDATAKVLERESGGRVANKMMRYWDEREDWLKQRGVATPKRLIVTWFAMLENIRGADWNAGNLLSQNAVGAFETYLKEQR